MNDRVEISDSSAIRRPVRLFTICCRWLSVPVSAVGVLCAVLSEFALRSWVAELVASLRVQVLIVLLVATGISLFGQRFFVASVMLGVCAWQATWLWSAFDGDMHRGPEIVGAQAFRICTVNVLTQNRHFARIITMLNECDADVIAILELGEDLDQEVRKALGKKYPHRFTVADDFGNFGIGLYSRFELQKASVFYLCEPPLPSLQATIDWHGQPIRLVATHPLPPMNASLFNARNLHLDLLAGKVKDASSNSPGTPIILVGDLNTTPWSPHFRRFEMNSGLSSATRGFGLAPTWYRWKSLFVAGIVIDHGFSTQQMVCTGRQILGDIGSDHRPVLFEFVSTTPPFVGSPNALEMGEGL